jgi:tRNA(Ile)-lysidine synthase
MTPLAARTLEAIRRHALLPDGSRVLVALSGGSDSVALLLILRELEADGVLTVTGVAHLNHRLRGEAADEDERFCAELARRIGVRFISDRVDVSAIARAERRSIEDAASRARSAFFERAASACRADLIAVGHTKDDQAETFLLRLIRGAGGRGLSAIHPRAGRIIRPLIDVEREALRGFLAERGQDFREDASNADVTIPRNRVRHEVLPLLGSRFCPAITDVLARQAALARQDEEFLQQLAIKLADQIVLTDEAIRIDVAGLAAAPRALSSRVVRAALQTFAASRPITFDHVEQVLALADVQSCATERAVSLPGQIAGRLGNVISLRPLTAASRGSAKRGGGRTSGHGRRTFDAVSLSIPGEVEVVSQGVVVRAEHLHDSAARQRQWVGRGREVGVAAGPLELPLAVRSRRAGDRFRPLGAPGVRKLQDFFVDRKVPRTERDTVPLVVDGRDRIVWVVGQSVAEEFRVTDPAQGVILLKVRHLGGPG